MLCSLQSVHERHEQIHYDKLVHGFAALPTTTHFRYSFFTVRNQAVLKLILLEYADAGIGTEYVIFN